MFKQAALILSILLFLTSCSGQPARRIIQTQTATLPVCLAPCWKNITPGITTRNELYELLSANPKISDISETQNSDPWGHVIMWCDGEAPCGPGYIAAFASFNSKGIVQEINLDPGISLKLSDFIAFYGKPVKIVFSDPVSGPGYVGVDALYPEIGLAVGFFPENKGTFDSPKIQFNEDLRVVRIYYTIPLLDYYYSHNIMVEMNQLQEFAWKGYTHYP